MRKFGKTIHLLNECDKFENDIIFHFDGKYRGSVVLCKNFIKKWKKYCTE